jgi:hypothetical protein
MATAAILEVVYIAEARAHDGYHLCEVGLGNAYPFQRKLKLKNFVYFCRYHGNGSHIEICQHCMQHFKLPSSFL